MKTLRVFLLSLSLILCTYSHACEGEFALIKKPKSTWVIQDFRNFIASYPQLLNEVIKRKSAMYLVTLIIKYEELSARISLGAANYDPGFYSDLCVQSVSCTEFLGFAPKVAQIKAQSSASPFEDQHWKVIEEIVASIL